MTWERTMSLLILSLGTILLAQAEPTIGTVAGTGRPGDRGDGGSAALAELNMPFDVAFDAQGNLFLSDTSNHRVRRVDARTG
ncbi:MAG: hypothetical protein JOZ69_13825, partial [Myxococcales bacterium]|nr:hypothetical protein [Myxococcales bacterium]